MIVGRVTSLREAVIDVWVHGPQGQESQVEAVIDTGFNGYLTLSVQMIDALGLSYAGTTQAALGDGALVHLDVFEAAVVWDNRERWVAVLAAEGGALVGMSMLFGYRAMLEVEEGGSVIIDDLSSRNRRQPNEI